MLRSLKDFEGYKTSAMDGDIGKVTNFLLDDDRWIVRYLIVETGSFFRERAVLISPISFRQTDPSDRRFHLALTVDKIKNSPSIDVDKPVSRQHEQDYHHYYGYPYYWGDAGLWGMGAYPGFLATALPSEAHAALHDKTPGDAHLRSAAEVRGYHVHGSDAEIGHVDDFIIDDESWEVRYLVIDTSNWWFGKKVLVSPRWTTNIVWAERKLYVGLSREAIKNSPEWDPEAGVNRAYETRLYDYHGRPTYWAGAPPKATPPPRHTGAPA